MIDRTPSENIVPISDNPVLKLNIMKLTEKDFENCRHENVYFCTYDAITKTQDCNLKDASKQFTRIHKSPSMVLLPTDIKYIQFPRKDG
jgi:hypothetical protein